ncbi:hypothetical protein KY289_007874 [Solanum tuberosum]|nr:hypothetical protein KY289_007874 [Solanum tuberosum]
MGTNLTGCRGCYFFMDDIPKSNLSYECPGMTLVGCTFYGYLSQHAQESPRTPENKMEFVPLVHEKAQD